MSAGSPPGSPVALSTRGAIEVAIADELALSSRWKAKVRRPLFLALTRLLLKFSLF